MEERTAIWSMKRSSANPVIFTGVLYGGHLRGFLDVMEETLEEETTACENVFDGIYLMQDKIPAVMSPNQEHIEQKAGNPKRT